MADKEAALAQSKEVLTQSGDDKDKMIGDLQSKLEEAKKAVAEAEVAHKTALEQHTKTVQVRCVLVAGCQVMMPFFFTGSNWSDCNTDIWPSSAYSKSEGYWNQGQTAGERSRDSAWSNS